MEGRRVGEGRGGGKGGGRENHFPIESSISW